MGNDGPTHDDDQTTAPEQDETAGAGRPSLFSATRASRIRRPGATGRPSAPTGSAASASSPTTPMTPPTSGSASTATATAAGRPAGPRTFAHLAAGLCYLGTPIIPAAVLFTPTPHRFSRFHALQALALFIVGVMLAFCLSLLLPPTNVALGILFTLVVLAIIALALLWMAAAIAAFEGYAVALPVLDRLLPRTPDLEENPVGRIPGQQARLELAIAAGVSALLLILTFTIPTINWFKGLSKSTLAPLGLPSGLPLWMIVAALLTSLIVAGIGLIVLAIFLLGLRKGKFFPTSASWAAIVGAALTAAGTGLLLADTLQRALRSLLAQQFDSLVNASTIPASDKTGGAKTLLPAVKDGLSSLQSIAQNQQPLLLLLGALLLVLGVLVLLFLLSQLYYKR